MSSATDAVTIHFRFRVLRRLTDRTVPPTVTSSPGCAPAMDVNRLRSMYRRGGVRISSATEAMPASESDRVLVGPMPLSASVGS